MGDEPGLAARQKILQATSRGEWAVFADVEPRDVSAAFLRELLLGAAECTIRAPGVRLRNAIITGDVLDLADCSNGPDGRLPGLALENCDIRVVLDCCHAHLARLSLNGSKIREVRLRGAVLNSAFDFSGAQAAADAPGWIDGRGCTIDGEVLGNGANLCATAAREEVPSGQEQFALSLRDATIKGSVDLRDNFVGNGGVNIHSARIGGDFYADGAKVSEGEEDAFSAQGVKIEGIALLDRLDATGTVRLVSAKIGGMLQMTGSTLRQSGKKGNQTALQAQSAEIGGAVLLRDGFTAVGQVSLYGAKIGGNLECEDGHFNNENGDALQVQSAEIGGAVLLRDGFTAVGQVSLYGAKIGGTLDCNNGHFNNGNGDALLAENAEIGGAVLLRDRFTAVGRISFLNAQLGSLDCTGAKLRNDGVSYPGVTLNLSIASIRQHARFNNLTSLGKVSLWGCKVGGDLDCIGAKLITCRPEYGSHDDGALDGLNLTVGGDVKLDGARAIGRLVFENAQITGGMQWDGLGFPEGIEVSFPQLRNGRPTGEDENSTWGYNGKLDKIAPPRGRSENAAAGLVLAHAHIGAALRAYELKADVPALIDLSAANVHTLDDDKSHGVKNAPAFPAGWGGEQEPVPEIGLDGFVYQRIENFPAKAVADESRIKFWFGRFRRREAPGQAKPAVDIVAQRKKWLSRQNKTKFFPQAYRHLAMVMRIQGHVEEARQIAIAEGDAAPGGWANFKRRTFGACFGYGLDPMRATCSLFLMLGLGWVLVATAWHGFWPIRDSVWTRPDPVLVLSPNQVVALGAIQGRPLSAKDKIPDKDAIRCGRKEIIPPLYALDMMVPLVPLHQEDRCQISSNAGWLWPSLWAVFSILGKIITTLAIITYSGVLKPKDE